MKLEQPDYLLGVDLGQAVDFTALALLERPSPLVGKEVSYVVRHLKRYPAGDCLYQRRAVGGPAGQRAAFDAECDHRAGSDGRGAGSGRHAAAGGDGVHRSGQHHLRADHQRKRRWLAACAQEGTGDVIAIASAGATSDNPAHRLPEAEALVRELENFRIKITAAAHETFGAGGANQHDDLVMALALACWYAESHPRFSYRAKEPRPSNNPFANVPKGVFRSDDDEDAGCCTLSGCDV